MRNTHLGREICRGKLKKLENLEMSTGEFLKVVLLKNESIELSTVTLPGKADH